MVISDKPEKLVEPLVRDRVSVLALKLGVDE
jgi:hypothetical protein